ncbi:MAG: mycothiol system anti-sigma-R factor [Ancrocorticia sp.]
MSRSDEIRDRLDGANVERDALGVEHIEAIVSHVEEKLRDLTEQGCSCEEVYDHLFELLDSQMPLEQAVRLNTHMENCSTCNRLAEAETHVREIVRRSCCESAPSTLRIKITQQIAIFRGTT